MKKIFIYIMIALIMIFSASAYNLIFQETYDGVTSANFTSGTVGTTYKYNTTNGFQAQQNSFNQPYGTPTYTNILINSTQNYPIQFVQMAYIIDSGSNQYYGIQGIMFRNTTTGLNHTIFISPSQSQAFPKTIWWLMNDTFTNFYIQSGCSGITFNTWIQEILTVYHNSGNSFNISLNVTDTSGNPLCAVTQATYTNNEMGASNQILWGEKDGHGSGSPGYWFDNINIYMTPLPTSPSITFMSGTPLNNTNIYYHNILVNVSAQNIVGLQNVTIYVYNTTGLYNQSSNTSANFSYTFTGLPTGMYFINATEYDTGNISTETRNFTIKNPVQINNILPSSNITVPYCTDGSIGHNFSITYNDTNNPYNTMLYEIGTPGGSGFNPLDYPVSPIHTYQYSDMNKTINFNSANVPILYGVDGLSWYNIEIKVTEYNTTYPTLPYQTSPFENITYGTGYFRYCQPSWARVVLPCSQSGVVQKIYYDTHSCGFYCDLPMDNGTYENCTIPPTTINGNITIANSPLNMNLTFNADIWLFIIIIGVIIFTMRLALQNQDMRAMLGITGAFMIIFAVTWFDIVVKHSTSSVTGIASNIIFYIFMITGLIIGIIGVIQLFKPRDDKDRRK